MPPLSKTILRRIFRLRRQHDAAASPVDHQIDHPSLDTEPRAFDAEPLVSPLDASSAAPCWLPVKKSAAPSCDFAEKSSGDQENALPQKFGEFHREFHDHQFMMLDDPLDAKYLWLKTQQAVERPEDRTNSRNARDAKSRVVGGTSSPPKPVKNRIATSGGQLILVRQTCKSSATHRRTAAMS